jgi:hypothetical protein
LLCVHCFGVGLEVASTIISGYVCWDVTDRGAARFSPAVVDASSHGGGSGKVGICWKRVHVAIRGILVAFQVGGDLAIASWTSIGFRIRLRGRRRWLSGCADQDTRHHVWTWWFRSRPLRRYFEIACTARIHVGVYALREDPNATFWRVIAEIGALQIVSEHKVTLQESSTV